MGLADLGPEREAIRCRVRSWTGDPRLVPKRLAGLERVLNSLERLALSAELQKCLALEVEQILFGHGRLMRQRPARQNPRKRAAQQGIVIADAAGAPREMHAQLQRRLQIVAADRDGGA